MLLILIVAALSVFFVPVRDKFRITLLIVAAGAVICGSEAITAFFRSGRGVILVNEDLNPLFSGSYPVVDWLSAVFILITSVAAVSVTLYARDYLKAYEEKKSPAQISLHYFSLVLMYVSMVCVVVFRGGFAFLFSWELMTIASFLLLLFEAEKREVRRAVINYLILMHIGFVFLLTGFLIGGEGTLTGFDALGGYFAANNPVPLFLIFLCGFGMKAGIFPLHIWLPEAHPAAPSHISAFMSGIMIKMGVYGILRVLTYLWSDYYTIGLILLGVGIITALWGIVFAASQNDLKKLLAYSSIENIGIIFIGIGAGVIGWGEGDNLLALLGMGGALLHVVNHSFFKPLLFMGAGSVYLRTHTRSLEDLGGLGKKMPVTAGLFLIGSVAICGLPSFNGFISEFLIYLGLIKSVGSGTLVVWTMLAMAALALIGGLAVLVFTKAFGIGFLGVPRTRKAERATEVSNLMLAAQAIPLAGILLVGFVPVFFTKGLVQVISDTFHIYAPQALSGQYSLLTNMSYLTIAMSVFLLLCLALWWWRGQLQSRASVSQGPTWGCGFTAPDARMQYTGESYSEGSDCLGHQRQLPQKPPERNHRQIGNFRRSPRFHRHQGGQDRQPDLRTLGLFHPEGQCTHGPVPNRKD